jgi:hypothetical protein
MRRSFANALLSVVAVWLVLLDHCLIAGADMPVSGEIIALLVLQGGMVALVLLAANGVFPTLMEMATSSTSVRMKLFVFGLPLILFLISPVMISDSMHRARYGSIDKFVVHAHVWHDLACCFNPFATKQ